MLAHGHRLLTSWRAFGGAPKGIRGVWSAVFAIGEKARPIKCSG